MHNELGCLPEMEPDEVPYCIWSPLLPTQDTCRELLRRCPNMLYHVGRVCAIGGYLDLYQELDILPEIAVAEEARESGNTDIFNLVMSAPARYKVFDDYTRSLDRQPRIASLDGDTHVVSLLQITQRYSGPKSRDWHQGFEPLPVDITEDMKIAETPQARPAMDESQVLPWLYTPLPRDLPTIDKDLLILSAAYNGDIDRHARLRRPYLVESELACLVMGIYRQPLFAKYIANEKHLLDYRRIEQAIHARAIMSNNLGTITPETGKKNLPYCIWYPEVADSAVYLELYRRRPDMKLACARATIVGNYEKTFAKIDPPYEGGLMVEALNSPNRFFSEFLEKKHADGITVVTRDMEGYYQHHNVTETRKWLASKGVLRCEIDRNHVQFQEWFLNGYSADMSDVETTVCLPNEVREEFRRLGCYEFDQFYPEDGQEEDDLGDKSIE